MRNNIIPLFVVALAFASCQKDALISPSSNASLSPSLRATTTSVTQPTSLMTGYKLYTIGTGKHTCDQNTWKFVSLSQMNFYAAFDNSAIYTTSNPMNQNDINMLYGFSEGPDHLWNSARIGWSYNSAGGGLPSLKLYAYAYNRGVRESLLITPVTIGTDITCSIKLSGSNYSFTVNGITKTLARGLTSSSTSGYQLYPYFGGTETAPHQINIYIKNF